LQLTYIKLTKSFVSASLSPLRDGPRQPLSHAPTSFIEVLIVLGLRELQAFHLSQFSFPGQQILVSLLPVPELAGSTYFFLAVTGTVPRWVGRIGQACRARTSKGQGVIVCQAGGRKTQDMRQRRPPPLGIIRGGYPAPIADQATLRRAEHFPMPCQRPALLDP